MTEGGAATAEPEAGAGDAPHRIVLLVARDPLRAADGADPAHMARSLAAEGHEVTLVLLEDAVAMARQAHRDAEVLQQAAAAGVRIVADEDAMSRRGVADRAAEVRPAGLGEVVDLLFDWSDRQAWL